MNKAKLEIATFVVAILVVAAFATSPFWFPRGTSLEITPFGGSAVSGSRTAFTAILKAGNTEIAGNISWSVTAGSLDRTSGMMVVFTAPTVTANESVTIAAKFDGQGVYQASSTTEKVTVTPAPPLQATATTLKVSPTMFEVLSGGNQVLTASLTDTSGNALTGKTITWSVSPSGAGSLSSTTGTSVTYTAPTVQGNTTVTIVASFAGDSQYTAGSGSSEGTVVAPQVPLKEPTVLVISPSSFSIRSNESQVLNATLTDTSGNVLTGKTITWSVSPSGAGSLSSTTGSSVTYTAPTVQGNTTVTIVASFAGDSQYTAGSGSSEGTVVAPQPKPTVLVISPRTFTMFPDTSQVLNVTLTDTSGNVLTGKTITWSITQVVCCPAGVGSLSSTTGTSVTYTAAGPETTVTIVASFAGDSQYAASNGSSVGVVNCGCAA